jgi:hypothetical protein
MRAFVVGFNFLASVVCLQTLGSLASAFQLAFFFF